MSGMSGRNIVSATILTTALLIGVLEIEHASLRPLQKILIVSLDSFLDRFQSPEDNLDWATGFNGAMLPTQPVENVSLLPRLGTVPHDLAGVFLRVGPNIVNWPPQKRTHVFDGDGMVYSVRFLNGKAIFHCDYIRTPHYLYEQEVGREWMIRIGEFNGISGLIKALTIGRWKLKHAGLDMQKGISLANTAIGYTPDGKVWALHQSGPPFLLHVQKSGAFQSIGFDTLNGTLADAVSAHPKYDYRTKEIFFHNTDPQNQRFYVGRIADGVLKEEATLKADPPIGMGFNHDMFITKKYVVVIDGSMRFDIGSILKGSSLWNFDTTQKLRFGVYDRFLGELTAENFVWIEAPFEGEIVHTMFGYDEGDSIVLWTSICNHNPNRTEGVLGGMGHLHITRLVIDVVARTVAQESIAGSEDYIVEFGRVREDRIGDRARFGYSASGIPQANWKDFNFTGLIKWDFHEKRRAGVIQFPEGVIGGEPIFVPRGEQEDDGYISLFLHDTNTQNTSFVLYNATTFSVTPVVELQVPWKVPLGFHGWWLSEEQLTQQSTLHNL